MNWTELLKVGLLLVDAAQEIAKAQGLDPAEFTARRLQYEKDRELETSAAKVALRALLGKAEA